MAKKKKAKAAKKSPAKKPAKKAAKKPTPPPGLTLHGIYDALAALEKRVQASNFARKEAFLKATAQSKSALQDFCLSLNAGDCDHPTSDFCDPITQP